MPEHRSSTAFYRTAPPEFQRLRMCLLGDFEPFDSDEAFVRHLVEAIKPKDRPIVRAFLDEMFRRQLPNVEYVELWDSITDHLYFGGDMRSFTRMLRDALPDA